MPGSSNVPIPPRRRGRRWRAASPALRRDSPRPASPKVPPSPCCGLWGSTRSRAIPAGSSLAGGGCRSRAAGRDHPRLPGWSLQPAVHPAGGAASSPRRPPRAMPGRAKPREVRRLLQGPGVQNEFLREVLLPGSEGEPVGAPSLTPPELRRSEAYGPSQILSCGKNYRGDSISAIRKRGPERPLSPSLLPESFA